MKKTIFAAAVMTFVFAASVFAAGDGQPPMEPGPSFDQRKADILKKLDEQMHSLQEAKTCIQASKDQDDMKVCREKHIAERKKLQEEIRSKHGK